MLTGTTRSSKALSMAGMAVSIASMAYYAYQRWASDSDAILKHFESMYADEWQLARSTVARDHLKQLLSLDAVEAMQQLVAKVCGCEYKQLVVDSRIKRRTLDKNHRLEYEAVVVNTYQDINALVLKYTQKICAKLDLEYTKFEESVEKLIEDNQYEETATKMLITLKQSLIDPSVYKHYSDEEIVEMYMYCNEEYSLYKPRTDTFRGPIRVAILEDSLFAKHAIEEEQLDHLASKRSRIDIKAARFSLDKMKRDDAYYRSAGPDSILLQKLNKQPVMMTKD